MVDYGIKDPRNTKAQHDDGWSMIRNIEHDHNGRNEQLDRQKVEEGHQGVAEAAFNFQ